MENTNPTSRGTPAKPNVSGSRHGHRDHREQRIFLAVLNYLRMQKHRKVHHSYKPMSEKKTPINTQKILPLMMIKPPHAPNMKSRRVRKAA